MENPLGKDFDQYGNARYLGYVGGQLCRVVVASDDPDTIITIHDRSHL